MVHTSHPVCSMLPIEVDSFLTKDVNVVVTGIKGPHSDLQVDAGSCTAGGKQSRTPRPLVCTQFLNFVLV